ncbi:MAG: hypothetical protein A2Z42_01975 [Candidatus Woykebacteria bacterium RBG_19FT_COMBO_43_10]|uniref:Uncharacterized protein n=1 Tax=Candidatus Woykebacteria bacterium RBG_19FT_COMBO_43_10 TaxID=1802598 RepID=A0A1G1WID5_9BACT|nr:MAG: hypothetical protein A2Z42_01975 [Candidatus Woykebacteria bacterium RBG_19FT_COMBO_43_10]
MPSATTLWTTNLKLKREDLLLGRTLKIASDVFSRKGQLRFLILNTLIPNLSREEKLEVA